MMRYKAFALFALGALTIGAANAVTFATFDDPALSGATPLFAIDTSAKTLNGGWSGAGLTLEIPFLSETFHNATFTMTQVNYVPSGFGAITGGGEIDFKDSSNALIFKVNFDSGELALTGFGGNEFIGSNVVFSGPGIPATTNDEFAFAFANLSLTKGTYHATAAFTSSAEAVPEPVSMMVLGTGLVGLLARRRRKA